MMISKFIAFSVFLILLTSCAEIVPVPFMGPNGEQAYSMICSGMGRSPERCYQKAGEICKSGYTIIGRDVSVVTVPINGQIVVAPQAHIAIECK